MTKPPYNAASVRRVGQTLSVAFAFAILIAAAASAQWGWSQGSAGGWWSNQSAGGTRARQTRRRRARQQYAPQQQQRYAPRQRYAPGQQYAPQRQYTRQQAYPAQRQYVPYYPSNQPNAQYPYASPYGQQYQRREPPTLAYGPPDEQELRRSRSSRGAVRIQKPEETGEPAAAVSGGETMFCVRLCDGRFFPLSREGRAKPEKICSALCPASRTKVFEGSSIDESTAADGSHYEKLKTAFLYRKELVEDCTCNGKNAFGLARIDIRSDPTLQAGDIVVMADGLKVFSGMRGRRRKTARFTPIRKSSLVSRSFRRTLSRVEIAKTRQRSGRKRQAQQDRSAQR